MLNSNWFAANISNSGQRLWRGMSCHFAIMESLWFGENRDMLTSCSSDVAGVSLGATKPSIVPI